MWVPISSSMLTRLLQWLSTQVQEQGRSTRQAAAAQVPGARLPHGSAPPCAAACAPSPLPKPACGQSNRAPGCAGCLS